MRWNGPIAASGGHRAASRPAVCRYREALSILLRVLAPITPHIGMHLWRELGFGADIFAAGWPEPDEAALEQDEIELVLQINGKTARQHPGAAATRRVQRSSSWRSSSALAQKYIAGQAVKKIVVVPGRLVNVVV